MRNVMLLLLAAAVIGLVMYFVNPGLFKSADRGTVVKQEGIAPAAKQDSPKQPASRAEEKNLTSKANMDICTFCSNGKMKCRACGGTGSLNKEKCANCAGTGYVNCYYCGGSGYVKRRLRKTSGGVFGGTKASTGKGTTTIGGDKTQDLMPGDVINCKRCKGTGYISVPVKTSGAVSAGANGEINRTYEEKVCPECKGQGIVMVPLKKN